MRSQGVSQIVRNTKQFQERYDMVHTVRLFRTIIVGALCSDTTKETFRSKNAYHPPDLIEFIAGERNLKFFQRIKFIPSFWDDRKECSKRGLDIPSDVEACKR